MPVFFVPSKPTNQVSEWELSIRGLLCPYETAALLPLIERGPFVGHPLINFTSIKLN